MICNFCNSNKEPSEFYTGSAKCKTCYKMMRAVREPYKHKPDAVFKAQSYIDRINPCYNIASTRDILSLSDAAIATMAEDIAGMRRVQALIKRVCLDSTISKEEADEFKNRAENNMY